MKIHQISLFELKCMYEHLKIFKRVRHDIAQYTQKITLLFTIYLPANSYVVYNRNTIRILFIYNSCMGCEC